MAAITLVRFPQSDFPDLWDTETGTYWNSTRVLAYETLSTKGCNLNLSNPETQDIDFTQSCHTLRVWSVWPFPKVSEFPGPDWNQPEPVQQWSSNRDRNNTQVSGTLKLETWSSPCSATAAKAQIFHGARHVPGGVGVLGLLASQPIGTGNGAFLHCSANWDLNDWVSARVVVNGPKSSKSRFPQFGTVDIKVRVAANSLVPCQHYDAMVG